MKKSDRFAYSRHSLGYSTLVLATGWLSLWLLWPRMRLPAARTSTAAHMTVAYVRLDNPDALAHKSPIVFALSSVIGFSHEDSDPTQGDTFDLRPRVLAPRHLDLPLTRPDPLAALRIATTPLPAVERYRPVWPDSKKSMPPPREPKLLVESSPCLKECGFQPADGTSDRLAALGRAVQASAEIEILEDGRIGHVFITDSSGDKAVDRLVVGALEQGSVLYRKRKKLVGRVTVSFGQ